MTKRQICWTSDLKNKCLHDLVLKARALMEGAVADSGNKQEREVRERWKRKLLKIKHPSTSVWPVETQNDVTVCGSKNDLEKSEGSRALLRGRLEEGISLHSSTELKSRAAAASVWWWQPGQQSGIWSLLTEGIRSKAGQNASLKWFRSSRYQLRGHRRRAHIDVTNSTNINWAHSLPVIILVAGPKWDCSRRIQVTTMETFLTESSQYSLWGSMKKASRVISWC